MNNKPPLWRGWNESFLNRLNAELQPWKVYFYEFNLSIGWLRLSRRRCYCFELKIQECWDYLRGTGTSCGLALSVLAFWPLEKHKEGMVSVYVQDSQIKQIKHTLRCPRILFGSATSEMSPDALIQGCSSWLWGPSFPTRWWFLKVTYMWAPCKKNDVSAEEVSFAWLIELCWPPMCWACLPGGCFASVCQRLNFSAKFTNQEKCTAVKAV